MQLFVVKLLTNSRDNKQFFFPSNKFGSTKFNLKVSYPVVYGFLNLLIDNSYNIVLFSVTNDSLSMIII
jgi:hypothetical protein